jgi:hypothetical protein
MPAVKKLHQESDSNTKPDYLFGHSCQAIALLTQTASSILALPLAQIRPPRTFGFLSRSRLVSRGCKFAKGRWPRTPDRHKLPQHPVQTATKIIPAAKTSTMTPTHQLKN